MAFNTTFSTFRTNGVQIATNNFQWLWSNTANPTTRPDGRALVAGDRILVTAATIDAGLFEWNGTLWLGESFYFLPTLSVNPEYNFVTAQSYPAPNSPVSPWPTKSTWVEAIFATWNISSGAVDASNFWTIQFSFNNVPSNVAAGTVGNVLIQSNLGKLSNYIGAAFTPSANNLLTLRTTNIKTGTAGTLVCTAGAKLRVAR
jgi:hypothetical protein